MSNVSYVGQNISTQQQHPSSTSPLTFLGQSPAQPAPGLAGVFHHPGAGGRGRGGGGAAGSAELALLGEGHGSVDPLRLPDHPAAKVQIALLCN